MRAAEQLGGMEALAARLDMSPGALRVYLVGTEPVPQPLFLRIVDVLEPPGRYKA
jgi:hypothetical protein